MGLGPMSTDPRSIKLRQGSPKIIGSNLAEGWVYDPTTGNAYSDLKLQFETPRSFTGTWGGKIENRALSRWELYGSKQYLVYTPEGGEQEKVDITDKDIFGMLSNRRGFLGAHADNQLKGIDERDVGNLSAADKEYWQHAREREISAASIPFRYGTSSEDGLPLNQVVNGGQIDLFKRPEFSPDDLKGMFKAFAPKFSGAPNYLGTTPSESTQSTAPDYNPNQASAPVITKNTYTQSASLTPKSLVSIRRRKQSSTGSILDPQGTISG